MGREGDFAQTRHSAIPPPKEQEQLLFAARCAALRRAGSGPTQQQLLMGLELLSGGDRAGSTF